MEKLRQHRYTAHNWEKCHCTRLFSMGWIVWCESCQTSMNRNEMTNFSSRVIRHDLGWCCRKGPCSAKAVAVLGATCAPCCFGCSARCVLLKGCCCSLGAGFQGAVLGAVLGRVDPPASKERTTKYKTPLLNLWIMLVHFFFAHNSAPALCWLFKLFLRLCLWWSKDPPQTALHPCSFLCWPQNSYQNDLAKQQ